MDKPTCKVHGMIERNAICSSIIVGMKYCGATYHCEHKSHAEMIVKMVKNAVPSADEQKGGETA